MTKNDVYLRIFNDHLKGPVKLKKERDAQEAKEAKLEWTPTAKQRRADRAAKQRRADRAAKQQKYTRAAKQRKDGCAPSVLVGNPSFKWEYSDYAIVVKKSKEAMEKLTLGELRQILTEQLAIYQEEEDISAFIEDSIKLNWEGGPTVVAYLCRGVDGRCTESIVIGPGPTYGAPA